MSIIRWIDRLVCIQWPLSLRMKLDQNPCLWGNLFSEPSTHTNPLLPSSFHRFFAKCTAISTKKTYGNLKPIKFHYRNLNSTKFPEYFDHFLPLLCSSLKISANSCIVDGHPLNISLPMKTRFHFISIGFSGGLTPPTKH